MADASLNAESQYQDDTDHESRKLSSNPEPSGNQDASPQESPALNSMNTDGFGAGVETPTDRQHFFESLIQFYDAQPRRLMVR